MAVSINQRVQEASITQQGDKFFVKIVGQDNGPYFSDYFVSRTHALDWAVGILCAYFNLDQKRALEVLGQQ